MKNKLNFLLGLFAFVAATQASFAQTSCTPNAPTGNAGVFPAPDDIPCIERGVPYDFTMQLENFVTLNYPFGSITVDWTRIDSIENFPCGISWQSDKLQYAPGETGCIRVSGTSTELAGQYPLRIYITMQVQFPILGTLTFSDELQNLISQAGLANDYRYVSRVIETGDACPPRDIYSTSVASGEECPVCSAPALPVSSTLPPTASQITVAIGSPDVIVDLNVSVNITHTFIGDLTITLQSPAGTSITLFSGCGGQSDINAIFDDNGGYLTCPPAGNVLPAEALSAFVGESVDGAWTLTVTDNSAGDDGVLNEWCLHPTLGAPPPANDNCADVIPASIAAGDSIIFTGSTSGATPDIFLPGFSLPAVWEAFTLSSCSDVKISFCGSGPSAGSIFSLTYLLTSCPPPMVSLSGQIIYSPACPDFNDYFFPALQPGTYYIAVSDDPAGNPTGMYSVAVSAKDCPPPPPNDNCADVIPAAITNGTPVTFTGTTVGATRSPEEDAFVGYTVVWEAVTLTGSCNKLIVDFCGTAPGIMGVVLSYYSDCPLSTLNYSNISYITCPDGGSNGMLIFYNLAAGTYYLPVMADVVYNTPGDYTMNVLSIDCVPPPSNDDCSNVVPVTLANGTPVTFTGTTNGVTSSADEAAVLGTAAVWEAVTLTGGCNNLTVDFCGTAGISSATLDVYTDCPLTAYTYGITDFTCPDGNQRFSFSNMPAGTYYLPVPDFLPGDYTMNVLSEDCPPPPANDDCFTAIPVTCGQTVSGSTLLANYDYPGYCGTGNDAPGIWYSFTGTGDLVTLSTCDMADFDTRISVFEGDCSVLNCVGGNEDGYGCGGYTSQFSFISQPGTEYRILIHGYYYATGNFYLSVSCTTPPPPPPNDNCADVLPVTLASGVPVTFTGTTVGATASADEYLGAVVWEAVTLTGICNKLTLDFCGTAGTVESYTSTSIFSDCLLSGSYFGNYDYNTCPDGNITIVYSSLTAGTYYIPVAPVFYGAPGDYTMNVISEDCPPPPANDDCSNVTPVGITNGVPVTFNGTTLGARQDSVELTHVGYAVVWEAFMLSDSCSDVTISFCGSISPTFSANSRLYLNCPLAGFADDPDGPDYSACGDGNVTYTYYNLRQGAYYIPIYADQYWLNPLGDYTITVSSVSSFSCPPYVPPPANDNCSDVTPVDITNGVPASFTGTTSGATMDVFEMSDLGYKNVWEAFTLTAPCSNITLSYCGSVSPTYTSLNRLYRSCTPGDYIEGYYNYSCGNGNYAYYFNNVPAGTYYNPIFADPLYLTPLGDYTLVVTAEDCPPPPPNDNCSDVIPVAIANGTQATFTGTTAGATMDVTDSSFFGNANVWEAFTLTAPCSDVTLSYCGSVAPFYTNGSRLYTSCPGSGSGSGGNCLQAVSSGGTPPYYYYWSDGETTNIICPNAPGTYCVTMVDNAGCSMASCFTLGDCQLEVSVGLDSGCLSASVSGGTPPYNYVWSDGATEIPHCNINASGYYTVTVTDVNGCTGNAIYTFGGCQVSITSQTGVYGGSGVFTPCDDGSYHYIYYFNNLPAGTYYNPIIADPAYVSPLGDYTLTVSSSDCPQPPANDNVCGAETLPLGVSLPFDNTLATAESGEVTPGAGTGQSDCNSQDGWCALDLEVQNSIWYHFTAPASGHVTISAEPIDAQLAVYTVGDCSDFSTFIEAGANDGGNPGCEFCPLVELTCLTPGQTYYVQLDGYAWSSGAGAITATDAGTADINITYTLVDASTDLDIGPLQEGDILNKRLLPPFNIRADADACGVPAGSVKFVLNGSTVRIENIAPFAIAGDAPAGNYKTWNISPGSYHLETFAYRNRNMNGGLLGLPGEINFTVIDDECYPLTVEINTDLYGEQTSFKLTDRTDNTLVGSIASGTIGSYSAYRQSFCVPADHCYEFKIFDGDGICCSYGSGSYTVTFNREVVASGGEFVSSETASFGSCAPDCEGVIGGTAITDVSGACCQPEDLDCSGVCFGTDNNSLQVVSFTLVDSKTDADIRPLNDGDVVDLSATPFISVRANLCASAGSVRFKVNGSNFNLENIAPYAIAGDAPPGNYKKWNVSPGTYAIEAIPYPGAGGSGTAGVSKTITIKMIGGSPKADDENAALNITEDDGLAIRAYPNPFNDVLTFEFSIPEEGSVILELFRISGEKIATVFEGKAAGGEINRKILNTGLLASGLYLYRLKTSSTVVTERVMLVR